MVPIVIQFFSKTGVKHGILEFIEQMHESADDLFANIKYVLEANELKLNQLVSLGSDNTNVNVGNHHSVFALFKKLLPGLITVGKSVSEKRLKTYTEELVRQPSERVLLCSEKMVIA
ncbi:unnamed protein product [Rotaria magnacalcarata]